MERVVVEAVEPGVSTVTCWCDWCQNGTRHVTDIWALTADGLVRIGVFSECAFCRHATEYMCSFCTQIVAVATGTVKAHIATHYATPV